ncbi:chemotaxis protein CheW [Aurantiacibacter sp. MUD11]|uniref:chemotaxis protein CheW n=1 Tax=Aurantiacibacter sp. MUD11 TaxID=3003265 RepID=UPI0022AB445E|nr:chemotaxis protein CheW [Aurantiacibacter sp. MUD11]WAT17465.1 chemotaxis protein CheW [Aurantiacibacter sp. MUD11]
MSQLLVTSIAGRRVALPTAGILSVIELGKLERVPRAPSRIAGLTALRSRVLTVIDCAQIVDGHPSEYIEGNGLGIVIDVDDHGYALMVDHVEDVTEFFGELEEVKADLGGEWTAHALGMAETEIGPLLVISPERFVSGAETAQAA